jgi:hypothetical protein
MSLPVHDFSALEGGKAECGALKKRQAPFAAVRNAAIQKLRKL